MQRSAPFRLACVTAAFSLWTAALCAQNEPLSAIEWLSDSVAETPPPATPQSQIAVTALPPAIRVAPLSALQLDAVGLQPASVQGLPGEFWGTASSDDLVTEILGLGPDLPIPLARLVRRIFLAELSAPVDAGPEARLFVARLDYLLAVGALDKAQALLERAGAPNSQLLRRAFDIALLTGRDSDACALPDTAPAPAAGSISLTIQAEIFCLVQSGDWRQADTALSKAREDRLISSADGFLLDRFLHPELHEGAAKLPMPQRVSPLVFRLHQGIGEALPLASLPNAFAYSALDSSTGWKTRLRAAERLARSGALSPSQLLAIYSERQAAASGGVWERVTAVQAFENALSRSNDARLSQTLIQLGHEMERAGLFFLMADLFAQPLQGRTLSDEAAQIALRLQLLSDNFDQVPVVSLKNHAPIVTALVSDSYDIDQPDAPLSSAIWAAFQMDAPESSSQTSPGLDVLRALRQLSLGRDAAPSEIEAGLVTLRQNGFSRTARQFALCLLLEAA